MPTVLIVDDSLSVRKVAERVLQEAGLDVALAANGEAAIAWLSTHQPDLVIADVIMPDMSGFEVCSFIRAQAHMATMPVLLFSGFVDDDVARQAAACKADGVVKKPFQGASLYEQVTALLAARQEQDVLATAPDSPLPVTESTVRMAAVALIPVPEIAPELAPDSPVPVAASTVRLHREFPIPVLSPVDTPTPLEQFQDDRHTLREIIQQLEARVAEQAQGLAQLERQAQNMRRRLEDEETHAVEWRARLADLEPAVAASTHLFKALTEFARQMLASQEQRTPTNRAEHDG